MRLSFHLFIIRLWKRVFVGGMCTEVFYAFIPTLFSYLFAVLLPLHLVSFLMSFITFVFVNAYLFLCDVCVHDEYVCEEPTLSSARGLIHSIVTL